MGTRYVGSWMVSLIGLALLTLCILMLGGNAFARPLFPHPAVALNHDEEPVGMLATDLNDV